jgi:hypothetical protein
MVAPFRFLKHPEIAIRFSRMDLFFHSSRPKSRYWAYQNEQIQSVKPEIERRIVDLTMAETLGPSVVYVLAFENQQSARAQDPEHLPKGFLVKPIKGLHGGIARIAPMHYSGFPAASQKGGIEDYRTNGTVSHREFSAIGL